MVGTGRPLRVQPGLAEKVFIINQAGVKDLGGNGINPPLVSSEAFDPVPVRPLFFPSGETGHIVKEGDYPCFEGVGIPGDKAAAIEVRPFSPALGVLNVYSVFVAFVSMISIYYSLIF